MDFAEAIAVIIASIFTAPMTDGIVLISPTRQSSIDIILVREDPGSSPDNLGDDRPDRRLLDIRQHLQDDLSIPLDQTENRRFLLFQRSPAARSFEPVPAALPAFF